MSSKAAPSDAIESIKKIKKEEQLTQHLTETFDIVSESLKTIEDTMSSGNVGGTARVVIRTASGGIETFGERQCSAKVTGTKTINVGPVTWLDTDISALLVPEGYYVEFKSTLNLGLLVYDRYEAGFHDDIELPAYSLTGTTVTLNAWDSIADMTIGKAIPVEYVANDPLDDDIISENEGDIFLPPL